jgi:hypothetical protein
MRALVASLGLFLEERYGRASPEISERLAARQAESKKEKVAKGSTIVDAA